MNRLRETDDGVGESGFTVMEVKRMEAGVLKGALQHKGFTLSLNTWQIKCLLQLIKTWQPVHFNG